MRERVAGPWSIISTAPHVYSSEQDTLFSDTLGRLVKLRIAGHACPPGRISSDAASTQDDLATFGFLYRRPHWVAIEDRHDGVCATRRANSYGITRIHDVSLPHHM